MSAGMTTDDQAMKAVEEAGRAARDTVPGLAVVPAGRLDDALQDRLRLDQARLSSMAGQLRALADVPAEPSRHTIRELPGGLRLEECRRPVGVIGANFEARPNVVVDI